MKVAILGTGYVGLTTGVCLAYLGHEVACMDTDESKVAGLRAGRIPIYEPGLEDLMKESEERLRFTTSHREVLEGAEVVFIAVGTPPRADGSPDLRFLRAASESIGANLPDKFLVVVNKSTVPIGSGNWVESLIRGAAEKAAGTSPEGRFSVASNPEFLREGSALADSLYPDRVVIGADNGRTLEILYTLYRPLLDQSFPPPSFLPRPADLGAVPLVSTDLASAELIKYAANAFLSLKISFINEIGALAERVGADIREVARGIGLDTRIGPRFLQAGLGWGGSCFGKDTSALISTAAEYGLSMPIVNASREVNQRQRVRVVEKLLQELKILKGRTIALLGLAFKPNTDDLREAPSIEIIRRLLQHGALVRAHDPVAMTRFRAEHPDLEIELAEETDKLFERADAAVLVTEWSEYNSLDWPVLAAKMRTPVLVDGRSFLDENEMKRSGFRFLTIP
jgi:UDPglucose 6-dehydrogenase